ncbi:strychnine-10-hydroxylase-like [Bidens hawaiensis]|uniref:strychnine-10-hydroxylase-like n=1 Tax=Bidens hawaiensis TaxID=980011 RepID=UPI00404B7EBD
MEFHTLSFSTTLTSILVVFIIAFLLQVFRGKKANIVKNPAAPQAKGAWPVIGHLHLLGGSRIPQHVLGDMADKYGPIFTIKLGVHQALVVSSGAVAKECLTTNDKAFATRPKSKAIELIAFNYASFPFSPYGPYWRQARKIITLEALSQRRVEMLGHTRVSEIRESTKDIYEMWRTNKDSVGSDMIKVDMQQWFGNLVINLLMRIVTGHRFHHSDEEGVRFQNAVKKFFELLTTFVASDFLPFTNGLDLGGYEKEMKKTGKEIDSIVDGWLRRRKRERESISTQQEGDQLFMDVLISALQDATEEDFPGYDHDTVIKATSLGIIVAGSDTSAVTLTWALSLLLNNPSALKAVQDEIDEHVGKDRLVEESDLKNLVYLDAVVKETMRLHPAGPLSIPRESMEDCIVSGYNIPKGTRLFVNIWKIHRDPNIWADPSEFRPERFLTSHKDIDLKGKSFELLPFGSGRRMCPGIFFVLKVLPLTLANVIQQFEINKPSNEPIDMTESPGQTGSKTTPLDVLLTPRLSHDMFHGGA